MVLLKKNQKVLSKSLASLGEDLKGKLERKEDMRITEKGKFLTVHDRPSQKANALPR